VDLNDWILSLHVLSAFALVGAEVIFTLMIVALWNTDNPARVVAFMPLSRVGAVLVMAGIAGTIVFGVWLAISLDAYQLWDGWVIAALVLWAVGTALGQRSGEEYNAAAVQAQDDLKAGRPSSLPAYGASRAFWLHVGVVVVILLILIDMIWKPGA
jgi:uncharacterized membrane protein